MNTYQLEIVTPEKKLYSGQVAMTIAKAKTGEIGIMAGHTPLVTSLGVGPVRIQQEGQEHLIAVIGGFMEVQPDKVVILAETAELAEEIDLERAKAAKERAEKMLRSGGEDIDFRRAEMALLRALTRLRVKGYEM